MKNTKRTFKFILVLALPFLMLLFINIGCAGGAAPEEEWNKTFGGTAWGEISSIQQITDGGYILAGYRWLNDDYEYLLVKTDSNGKEQWNKTFGGTEDNYASFVQQTTDGGYIIAGNTYLGNQYHYNHHRLTWLVKTDSNGNEQWNKTLGEDWDDIYSVQQTTDNGYIFAGSRYCYSAGGDDFLLVKTDSNGNEQWSKIFGGTNRDYAYSVQQTSDGGYIISGETYSYSSDYWSDFWLVKTDSNGNEQWNKTFEKFECEETCSVRQTIEGGYIIAGSTDWYSAGSYDFLLVKTDSNGNEQWNKTFGGTNSDWAYSVQQTTDSGYIIAGYTESYGTGESDFWLVKTDSNGNGQWSKTFGGTNRDYAYSVQQTTDSGYIIAGNTWSYGGGDFWFVKTDSNGNEQWNKVFEGYDRNYANSVRQTTDGGYIVTGYTESYGAGKADFWLVKTDSNGNEQWNKTFGGTGWDNARSVRQTTGGGYIIAGYTESYGAGESDFWLVKTDSNGNEQWNKTFGGTGRDNARSVQQTTDGGYIIAGDTESYDASEPDFWLVKTDSNGNEQWNKKFGGTRYDTASSVQQTTDGGYIIAGDISDGYYHFWLIKTDSNGNEQWNKIFDRSNYDYAYSVQQTTDGGYIMAGWTYMNGYYCDYDFWVVKTDSNGNEQWNKTFGGIYSEGAHSVQQTIDGGYIIAGYTIKWNENDDFWLVKIDSTGNEQWNKTIGGTKDDRAYSVRETAHGGYIIAGVTESYSGGGKDFWLVKINDNWKNEWIGEDSEGGSEVTTVELQEAIHHWLEDIPVRGHIMSSTDLQEIIAIWLSG